MKIVIDIPERVYKASQILDVKHEDTIQIPLEVIANSTPLPKGHGDLKDVDKLKHAFIACSKAVDGVFTDADIASIILNSPTIIKTDKGV